MRQKTLVRPEISEPLAMFHSLDRRLEQMTLSLNMVVFGGIVLQRVYSSPRATHDVDSLTELDNDVFDAVKTVGKEFFGERPDSDSSYHWVNDDALQWFRFDEILPAGWQERAWQEAPLFQGQALSIYPPSRRDLMLTKLFGFFTRQSAEKDKDLKDLKVLGVSSEEVMGAVDDLHSMLQTMPARKSRSEIKEILSELWSGH